MSGIPNDIEMKEHAQIPLSDGVNLSARIWLPKDAGKNPVPAILEYIPYRKRDAKAERDVLTHPFFAGRGYAALRVDLRGSGDSEGLLTDEYLKQEQDDALEVIDWIAAQPWCSGNVGMIGISWGGFNGLQVAARRPPNLKAVISLCSTDDRYADDIHIMGGCLLTDKISWGSTMMSINSTPPDPMNVGEKWRDLWLERLNGAGLWPVDWHRHQLRDDFYKHGSICENYDDIEAACYLVGGWADGYSNAIFRMLQGLSCPKKGLVGPWAHQYPNLAHPGPMIGFLTECVRWWDYWLKGEDTGIMDEPVLRAWINHSEKAKAVYGDRKGHWVAEPGWPGHGVSGLDMKLSPAGLISASETVGSQTLIVDSPQTVGSQAGRWCPHGAVTDMPGDQRVEAGLSQVQDSDVLTEDFQILGAPVLNIDIASDQPNALLAATLSEVRPDGSATRVSFGLLNLTHRNSHEVAEPLTSGETYRIRLQLSECGHRFAAGSTIRLALSNAYWPIVWPSPAKTVLTISCGESALTLPIRPDLPEDASLPLFGPPEAMEPLQMTIIEPGETAHEITQDALTGVLTQRWLVVEPLARIDEFDWTFRSAAERLYSIHPDDPLSARFSIVWEKHFERGGWSATTTGEVQMRAEETEFVIDAVLDAYEGDTRIFSKVWNERIPRNGV
ncbi:MAG: CocE/NonD family hydrolase [Alphaproteobacteria bacterium]